MISVLGTVTRPAILDNFGSVASGGLGKLINITFLTLISLAGLYALFSFIFAGYTFLSAGGDSKKVASAWAKIWQTVLGLAIVASSVAIAAILGQLIFNDVDIFLQPTIFGA